ncbi:unnamed protein product [Caenorhabditis bovis]|uniref:Uncharacterized protein n=1 Tax=Caenorhabditis bovis TaxID=2654633 RepID=A0A8S1EDZ6_9PELO|nr:unnamed protein product [Caenorhabditis bovis]
MTQAMKLTKNPDQQRISMSLMEHMFNQSTYTSLCLIEFGVLDHILLTCKRANGCPETLRHASLGLANLALYSCHEGKKKIIQKKVPDWLFLLASQQDDLTRYYACLAICVLASTKHWDLESAVTKSGTLTLVEPFLLSHQATVFAHEHFHHSQGRAKEWLFKLLPMLKSMRKEARSSAAFHFTMEATIKKDQNKLDLFEAFKNRFRFDYRIHDSTIPIEFMDTVTVGLSGAAKAQSALIELGCERSKSETAKTVDMNII